MSTAVLPRDQGGEQGVSSCFPSATFQVAIISQKGAVPTSDTLAFAAAAHGTHPLIFWHCQPAFVPGSPRTIKTEKQFLTSYFPRAQR